MQNDKSHKLSKEPNEFMEMQYEKFLNSQDKSFAEFMRNFHKEKKKKDFIEFMQFRNKIIKDIMQSMRFKRLECLEFYARIFKDGLQELRGKRDGKPNAIMAIMSPLKEGATRGKQYMVKRNLGVLNIALSRYKRQSEILLAKMNEPEFLNLHLEDFLNSQKRDFVIISSCGYVGKKKLLNRARICFELVIDLDYIRSDAIANFINICDKDILPSPNLLTFSGTGLHLHYVLKDPINIENKKNAEILNDIKRVLTKFWWNKYLVDEKAKIQYQSIYQSFRLVGSFTKQGFETLGFELQNSEDYETKEFKKWLDNYKGFKSEANTDWGLLQHKVDFETAKALYPKWALNLEPKKPQEPKPKRQEPKPKRFDYNPFERIYKWFLDKLRNSNEVTEGHRYHCILALACFARKCGVNFTRLHSDAHSLLEQFNALGHEFTKDEIDLALRIYKSPYARKMTANYLSLITGIEFKSRKRKGLTREQALEIARLTKWHKNANKRQERQKRLEEDKRAREEKERLLNAQMAQIEPKKFRRLQKLNSRQRANREKKWQRIIELETAREEKKFKEFLEARKI